MNSCSDEARSVQESFGLVTCCVHAATEMVAYWLLIETLVRVCNDESYTHQPRLDSEHIAGCESAHGSFAVEASPVEKSCSLMPEEVPMQIAGSQRLWRIDR